MWYHEKLNSCDKSTFYGNESELLTQKPEIILRYIFLKIMKWEFRENWTKLLADNLYTVFYI